MDHNFKHSFELTREDLQQHPFWVWCEMEDEGQPWYGEIESSTTREYTGAFPIESTCGFCSTIAKFHNGMTCDAISFFNGEHLQSPELFIGAYRIGFKFKDIDGTDSSAKNAIHILTTEFGGKLESLFPIKLPSGNGIFKTQLEITVSCLKSIAVFDGSLMERHAPENAG